MKFSIGDTVTLEPAIFSSNPLAGRIGITISQQGMGWWVFFPDYLNHGEPEYPDPIQRISWFLPEWSMDKVE